MLSSLTLLSALTACQIGVSYFGTKTLETLDKHFCTASIEDCFSDNSVLVTLSSNYSSLTDITTNVIELFEHVNGIESFENLSSYDDTFLKYIEDENPNFVKKFRQTIKLNLNKKSKDFVLKTIKEIEKCDAVYSAEPNYISAPSATANDSYYSIQWALNGTYGIDIEEAWNFSVGKSEIRVGVIDTGIISHEDLNGNVTSGFDFVNNNYITTDDLGNHGTCVAGIIGACGNNNLGIAGINHGVSIVPLQASHTNNEGLQKFYDGDIIDAITFATNQWNTDNKISILNLSVEGFGSNVSILNAVSNFPGLFIWSAGNDGINVDELNYINNFGLSNLISVGAYDRFGNRSIWSDTKSSNYGNAISIFAPGGSTGVNNCATTSADSYNSYCYFNGTSCSAPHVAGVAALLLSMDPLLTPFDIKSILISTGISLNISTPQGSYLVKRLNAKNAVKYLLDTYGSTIYLVGEEYHCNENINSSSNLYVLNHFLLRLNVLESGDYTFTVASAFELAFEFFSPNLVEINPASLISQYNGHLYQFSYHLLEDVYYLSSYFPSMNSGAVYFSVDGTNHSHGFTYSTNNSTSHFGTCSCGFVVELPHQMNNHYCSLCNASYHNFTDHYEWYSLKKHYSYCSCGLRLLNNHYITFDSFYEGHQYATCIFCGGDAEGIVIGPLSNGSIIIGISDNGSLLLANGIIVLHDDDYPNYYEGSLTFNPVNNNEVM